MVRTTRSFFEALRGGKHAERGFARPIEEITARLPSDTFLWLAWGSIAVSLWLWVRGRSRDATIVGLWAPTFLIHGVYNKLVKQRGHDRYESE